MGDINDTYTTRLDLPDQLEQPLCFTFREGGSRLIQDQYGQLRAKGLGDLHHLPFGAGQAGDLPCGLQWKAKLRQYAFRLDMQGPPVEQAMRGLLRAKKKVLRHRQLLNQGKFLEHGADPQGSGMMHGLQPHGLALEEERAAGRRAHAGDD